MSNDQSLTRHGPIRVALTGACSGYGRTLLAQLRAVPDMIAGTLVDPDTAAMATMLAELDLSGVTVVPDASGIDWGKVDVLVEATGRVEAGTAYAKAAIAHGSHVVMVSKEVETVAGVALAGAAERAGVRYLPGDGDQPANLVRLLGWVERVGLEVVALGKSGEYDLVFDPAAGTVTHTGETIRAPGMQELLALGPDVPETLRRREELLAGLKRRAAADYCEMTVVSQYTGALADREQLHYPVARPAELADVYAEREHGGLVGRPRCVDVFSALRLPGEASFAGGVFVVVRTHDPATWRTLAGKGHVVSRDGRYACVFWPYHLMGVETPLTIADAAAGTGNVPTPATRSILAGRTGYALPAGTRFAVAGHHHEIEGVAPVIRDAATEPPETAPFYLLGDTRLAHDVPAGHLLTFEDLTGFDRQAANEFETGRGRNR